MYQAIYYDFSTYTYYLRDDKQGWLDFQLQPTFWKRVSGWQEGARPVLTGGWAIPTRKYDKNDPDLLEKDIDKSLYALRELYYKEDDVQLCDDFANTYGVVNLDAIGVIQEYYTLSLKDAISYIMENNSFKGKSEYVDYKSQSIVSTTSFRYCSLSIIALSLW